MSFDPITAAMDFAAKIGEKVADKYLPASMSEKERFDARLEVQKLAIEEYKTAVADVQGARELAGKESESAPGWTKVLTVTHRPMWSFAMLSIFGWTIVAPYLGFPQIPLSEIHKDIMQTVIIFYFGGRSVEKTARIIKGSGLDG